MVSQSRWHNRLFHGWGIVCGLEVTEHSDARHKVSTDCAWRWVVVKAGVAVDCCGRMLVLERDQAFQLPIPPQNPSAKENGGKDYWDRPFLLCLKYHEEQIECVPALYAEDECDPDRREANRVREEAVLTVCDPENYPGCWPFTGEEPPTHCHDDCGESGTGPAGVCLEPDCVCGYAVPLAYVDPTPSGTGEGYTFTMQGRPKLPPHGNFLTNIIYHNWPHGGQVSLSTLRDEMGGQLKILFDRRLAPAEGVKNGVNEFTFVVQHSDLDEDLEFITPAEGSPTVEDGRWAVFTIDERQLFGRRGSISGRTIHVTLEGDFILDCHRNAVDVNYLGGELPTGNGTPGGVFKSWFRVVPDGYQEDEPWQQTA
jgi:hypothetical protein